MTEKLTINTVHEGDCLELMKRIPDGSVDMILCDLPYGTTACKWDTIIPFEPLWEQYERIIKGNGAIVLTASQPFSSALVMSNPRIFKYSWTWDKRLPTNHLNAKRQPLRRTEDVCVFYKKQSTYNPQMVKRETPRVEKRSGRVFKGDGEQIYGTFERSYGEFTHRYPTNIIDISNANKRETVHPTQKPVALFEYLIRTYTNEGEIVLDNCIGSGTTAVAAINTGRNFIGIEQEPEYVELARKRIADAYSAI